MSDREIWVDYAKAIGIILVVYGHVARGVFKAGMEYAPVIHNLVDSVIYSFHMPLFFFLSGLFFIQTLRKRGARGFFINKTETILYPFIVWSLLQGGIEVILSSHTNNHTSIADVLSLFWEPRAQFWFLYALFLISIISVYVYKNLDTKFNLTVFAIASLAYLLRDHFNLIPAVGYVSKNFVFFSLGILMYENKKILANKNSYILPVFFIAFVVLQCVFHYQLNLTYLTDQYLFSLVLALVSIIFIASLCLYLSKYRIQWLKLLGVSSLIIFLMHILVASGIRMALQKVFGIEDVLLHLVLGTLLGVMVPLMCGHYLKRYIQVLLVPPKLYFPTFDQK